MKDNSEYQDGPRWQRLAMDFEVRPDTIYLNHGSFGQSPWVVRNQRHEWIRRLDEQPMDFFVRKLEGYLWEARTRTAEFVGTSPEHLVFVENCTYGMNVIAESFELKAGDEVLLNNHEYGAVHRIWDRKCARSDAVKTVVQLPQKFETQEQIVEALLAGVTDNTRLLVVSHITSATALIMPVAEICEAFEKRGIPVVVDGPHAPAQVDLDVEALGCAYYTASCHKWLCAPLGSGFLYVHPRFQDGVQPPIQSWGRLHPAKPECWADEFTWLGTRDLSPYLSIPTAIEYLNGVGIREFQNRSRFLAEYCERRFVEAFGLEPIAKRSDGWYGSMAHVPLPEGDHAKLQHDLFDRLGVEVPIIHFDEKWYLRVSCHLYNSQKQIDALFTELLTLLGQPKKAVKRV